MYGMTTAVTTRSQLIHAGMRCQSTTTSRNATTRIPICARYRCSRRDWSSANGDDARVMLCTSSSPDVLGRVLLTPGF